MLTARDHDNPMAVGAGDAYGALCCEGERLANSEAELAARFVRTVMTARMTDSTEIAGYYSDHNNVTNGKPGKRLPTVGEVISDHMGYRGAPDWDDALDVVVRAARAGDAAAKNIIDRLAKTFARMHVEAES